MHIDVRASSTRFVTRTPSIESRHSFSFGPHYDSSNVSFGVLTAHNEEALQPGGGFAEHPHRGVDIVTWVISGALLHVDDVAGSGQALPGVVQLLRTGRGVRHSETNSSDGVTRYLQMWISSDDETIPSCSRAQVNAGVGEFAIIASGSRVAPLRLTQPAATLMAASLDVGAVALLPRGKYAHLFVIDGGVLLDDVRLSAGDAARITDADSDFAAASITSIANARLLVWVMDDATWRPAT